MSTINSSRKLRSLAYWMATSLTAFVFLSGGAAYLAGASFAVAGVTELGYPTYFVTFLGFWKTLGGLAVLAPRLPRVKEWAYAGMAFDLTGAAVSHAAAGHPAVKVLVPLGLLGIIAASWALRPQGRQLAVASDPDAIPDRSENLRDPCPTAG